jgi:hypothetical protein
MAKAKRRAAVSAEDFIRTWQKAKTVGGVADALGLDPKVASIRAVRYRRSGIPLKKFPKSGRPPLDIPRLTALAKSLAKKAKP